MGLLTGGPDYVPYLPREVSTALLAEAREAREAAAGSGGNGSRRTRAQAEFIILDASGDTVQIVTGGVTPGLTRVYWNYSLRTTLDALSSSEVRDSANALLAIEAIADSLVLAGEDSAGVARAATGAKNRARRRVTTSLSGGRPLQPAEFQGRPGENFPNRPVRASSARSGARARARSAGQITRAFNRALRDRGIRLGGAGPGFGGPQKIAEPGTYTVVLRLGSRTLTTELEVIRAEGYEPNP